MLVEALGDEERVYFQPPENIKLGYPCIIYSRDRARNEHADNRLYFSQKSYLVTVIDPDPDSPLPDKVAQIPKSSMIRHYKTDHLNHDVFTIFV